MKTIASFTIRKKFFMRVFAVLITIVMMLTVVPTTVVRASAFSDLPSTHWAYTEIIYLANQGIITGFPDSTFRPDEAVTREQFARLIIVQVEEPTQTEEIFADVPLGSWSNVYVTAAINRGIILPEAYGVNLGANEPITRQEAAVWMVRALGIDADNEEPNFNDVSDITYLAEIAAAVEIGLIAGMPGNLFVPHGTTTRAQAAILVTRMSNILNNDEYSEMGQHQINAPTANVLVAYMEFLAGSHTAHDLWGNELLYWDFENIRSAQFADFDNDGIPEMVLHILISGVYYTTSRVIVVGYDQGVGAVVIFNGSMNGNGGMSQQYSLAHSADGQSYLIQINIRGGVTENITRTYQYLVGREWRTALTTYRVVTINENTTNSNRRDIIASGFKGDGVLVSGFRVDDVSVTEAEFELIINRLGITDIYLLPRRDTDTNNLANLIHYILARLSEN